ncbi:hypothetical protein [Egicoccus sp. AB-alg6-2]|uniref:hypothetical protein n=1 Tax=Egicoccus sp. AB-alg6-2 TaxID=3242692 RepID=UPI00359E1454
MPVRTASFLGGAMLALVVIGTVGAVTADDPWEPEPVETPETPVTPRDPDPRTAVPSLHPAVEAAYRRAWTEHVCIPATGDGDSCRTHARSEAWPFGDFDPLGTIADTYSEPGYCDGFFFSEEGRAFCDALAAYYSS